MNLRELYLKDEHTGFHVIVKFVFSEGDWVV